VALRECERAREAPDERAVARILGAGQAPRERIAAQPRGALAAYLPLEAGARLRAARAALVGEAADASDGEDEREADADAERGDGAEGAAAGEDERGAEVRADGGGALKHGR
jgi:hypothetical protein